MPSAESILQGLTATANDWRAAAVGWHVLLAMALLAAASRRVSSRVLAYLLLLPLISVGGLAWVSGNPFNASMFALLTGLLAAGARRIPADPVRPARTERFVAGLLLLAFGWGYPHFLHVDRWAEYLIAAPLGLLPCPTLSALIGVSLLFDLYRVRTWSVPLAVAGVTYGTIGIFRLGVAIDAVLLAAAVAQAILVVIRPRERRSVRATAGERTCPLPGDDLIACAEGAVTHAITIGRPRAEVWPWLAQMGAGSRGGWYSYDMLDNGRRPSAARIRPELQQLNVGMIFPAMPGVTDCFTLLAFDAERFLILGWLSPDGRPRMTWAFVLQETADGATRLLVRARTDSSYSFQTLPRWLTTRVGPLIHFVMQRKQLLGIANRVAGTLSPSVLLWESRTKRAWGNLRCAMGDGHGPVP